MIEGWYAAAVAGAAVALATFVPRVIPPLRLILPELVAVAVAVAVYRVGPLPWERPGLWSVALTSQPLLAWALLVAVPLLARPRDLGEPTPANAVIGGVLLGPLATAAVLASDTPDRTRAGRLAGVAAAAGLLSPLNPATLLLVGAAPGWLLWASPIALAWGALAWPRKGDPWGEAPRPDVVWPALVGAVVTIALGSPLGLLVTAGGLAVRRARTGFGRPSPGAVLVARTAAVAVVAAAFTHLAGVAYVGGVGAAEYVDYDFDPGLLAALPGLATVLVDPVVFVAQLERLAYVTHTLPHGALAGTALVAAASPLGVAVACKRTGPEWRTVRGLWIPGLIVVVLASLWALGTYAAT